MVFTNSEKKIYFLFCYLMFNLVTFMTRELRLEKMMLVKIFYIQDISGLHNYFSKDK